jgi:hypothetical protein
MSNDRLARCATKAEEVAPPSNLGPSRGMTYPTRDIAADPSSPRATIHRDRRQTQDKSWHIFADH